MSLPQPFNSYATFPQAWLQAFSGLLSPGVSEIAPLSVTVNIENGSEGHAEDAEVFERFLDEALEAHGCHSIDTTANTIFPQSLWDPDADRQQLYERYCLILPKLMKMVTANRYGTYFGRLIAYRAPGTEEPVNQLEHVITTLTGGNRRRSALQASVFDPHIDHTHQRQRGFPCLQHVFFAPVENSGLAITGVYATQWLFDRGYGNYIGLYRLGKFMGHELDLQLTQVTIFAAHAKLGAMTKRGGIALADTLQKLL